jgi:hypothetical protein
MVITGFFVGASEIIKNEWAFAECINPPIAGRGLAFSLLNSGSATRCQDWIVIINHDNLTQTKS